MKNSPSTAPVSRREFLGCVSAGVGHLTLAQSAAGQSSTRHKLGVALCGLGNYARDQLGPALKLTQNCELRGVVTGSPEKGAAWAKEYGFPARNVYGYDTMAQLSENLDIDIVCIVTPNALHAQHVIAAAGAKKHVICEKPMAVSVAECDAMLTACRANNVKLSIGYRLQFEPHYDEPKRHARELDWGVFMRMSGGLSFVMKEPGWRAERKLAGGGPLIEIGIYPVQAACMAAGGAAPVAVTASERPKQHPEIFRDVEEGIEWTMDFAGGARGEFSTSYNDKLNKFRAEAAKGWIELNPAYSYAGLRAVTHAGPLNLVVAAVLKIVAQGHPGFVLGDFASNGFGDLSPGHYNFLSCAIIETLLTFFFVLVIIGATSAGAPAGFAPIAIGLTLTLILLVAIPVTNGSVNPARSTGPAIFAGKAYLEQLWFFWLAPVSGAIIAGILGRALFRKPG